MKNWITIALLAGITTVNAQELDKYKYFNIPSTTTDFQENQYQLTSRLNYYLGKKNFIILSENKSEWPANVNANPCSVINVDLVKSKSLFKNKLEIQFKDCNNKIVEAIEGSSNIKEYDKGFQDALQKALAKVAVHNYTGKENELPNIETVSKPIDRYEPHPVLKDEPTTSGVVNKKEPHPVIKDEINYVTNLKKVDLKEGGFLLMNESTMQTVAKFEPTLRPIIYRVTVFQTGGNKYASIGYTEGNTISYEYLENGKWKTEYIKIN